MSIIINWLKRPFCKHVYMPRYFGITVIGYRRCECGKDYYEDRFMGEKR